MDCTQIADDIARRLTDAIRGLPERFYTSFEYTRTGNNLTHPITWGLLSRIMWGIPRVATVGIDARFNLGTTCKFQPDLVGYDDKYRPIVFVDYESPNSSDARIPIKDVDAYLNWTSGFGHAAPYIVITTLPDCRSDDWELRYASRGGCNAAYAGRAAEIRANPCHFWYDAYDAALAQRRGIGVAILNFDGVTVSRKYPRPWGRRCRFLSRAAPSS